MQNNSCYNKMAAAILNVLSSNTMQSYTKIEIPALSLTDTRGCLINVGLSVDLATRSAAIVSGVTEDE